MRTTLNKRNYKETILEAKGKSKSHKAYKIREEDDEASWNWDLKVEKKALKKTMPNATDNELTIEAAAKIAKKNHTTRAKILAQIKPSKNVKGAKTWDKEGKVFIKESREVERNYSITEAITKRPLKEDTVKAISNVVAGDSGIDLDGRSGVVVEVEVPENTVYVEMDDTGEVNAYDYGEEFSVKDTTTHKVTFEFTSDIPVEDVVERIEVLLNSLSGVNVLGRDFE